MKGFFFTALLLLFLPVAAYGQPELIVRLEGEETAPLLHALQTGAADSVQAALFEGVEERRPVLPESDFARAPGAPRRSQPFTAYTLTVRDSTAFERLRTAWERRPEVRYVQPNYRYEVDAAESFREAPTYDDPYLDSLRHLEVIRAKEAWEATTGSEEVRIGFVDTGLFLEHPDLRSQLWINPGEDLNGNGRVDPSDFNGRDDDGNGYVDDLYGYDFVDRPEVAEPGDYAERDPDPSPGAVGTSRGHGTAVAGVLAAALDNGTGGAGVAPGSRLVPLRAFGGDGLGATDDIAAAIVYAAEVGLDVINLSFGRDVASPLLHESIQYAVSQGAVVVASAGNSGGGDPHYPSDYPEAISAGWLNEDGTDVFSSPLGAGEYGLGLDLGAPGTNVYTTLLPPENNDPDAALERLYGRRSGSSMAAPQVAGAAALLRSLDGSLSPAAVRSILTASAADLRAEGWDRRTASGRLDVAAALGQAFPARTEILRPGHDAGVSGPEVAVTGSAIDPSFDSFSVYYARGDTATRESDFDWQRIAGPVEEQVLRDTLALWDMEALSEGTYTLRLAVRLRNGRTVEDRRRVFVDRTPPEVSVRLLASGLVDGTHGIVADVGTDDLTTATLRVTQGGRTFEEESEHLARRHGLTWADRQGDGRRVQVALEAVNAAGQRTTYEDAVDVPPHRMNSALFTGEELDVRHGRILPRASDFDQDGLLEITFNRYVDGTYSDTLATYEWGGSGFARAHTIASDAPFIPRDVGDTNANDLEELLLSQVQGSVLLEQQDPEGYPDQRVPLDTTGLGGSSDMPTQLGRMTDLDADGHLELLGHNREQWRLFEYAADDEVYLEVARLENPTDPSSENVDGNGFEGPEALTGDFDDDGRRELLVGDEDGDWILYEARAEGRLEAAWTHETRRYFAGRRFAKGDFDGDGRAQFATYAENWQRDAGGENEPPFGFYYFWESTGDDTYRITDSLIVSGELSRRGAMATADFDGDGRDELVVVHPPRLYVLAYDEAEGWEVRYRRDRSREAPGKGLRSASLVTGDFDADGTPELVSGAADGHMRRFVYQAAAAQEPPPRWTEAVARDAETVALAWRASRADSVTVYHGPPGTPFDPLATTADSSLSITATERMRYRLRAWFDGAGSPLSEARTVRPHALATLAEVSYPDTATAKLVFTEPLASSTRAGQFSLKEGGRSPETLLLAEGDRAAILRFERRPGSGADMLRWRGLHDAEGTPVATTATPVAFPAPSDSTLIVSRWSLLDRHTVRLVFSEPLDPALASDPENYRLRPIGEVEAVDFEEGAPARADVHVGETRLGATGREQSLTVLEMRGQSGAVLAPEGGSIRLSKAAEDLRQVYIYPNPHRQRRHEQRVTIAGLPEESEVLILSTQGTHVKMLEEPVVNGGMAWDLTDRDGRRVPSGVYLVRVSAPDEQPVLKKVAVIR